MVAATGKAPSEMKYAFTRNTRIYLWNGRETADITFEDGHSDLLALLISKGYLDVSESTVGVRPTFYLEVKGTVQGCDAPLFMSKGQYERISQVPQPMDSFRAAPLADD